MTTINIVDVKESILKAQSTEKFPEVNQFKRYICSVSIFFRYLKKIIHEKIEEINNNKVVIT